MSYPAWLLGFIIINIGLSPIASIRFPFGDLIQGTIGSVGKVIQPWYPRPAIPTNKEVVKTDKGLVCGNKMISRSGKPYYAFTSIPYARPPLGPLRFEMPVPALPWDGVKEGPADLPDCVQFQAYHPYLNNVTFGTEDCLYLSVFTPQVGNKQLPVMIYIHGGGYRSEFQDVGKAIRSKYFLDEDIVLVIIKYRLGAFGFLSLEDKILPGNMGLKDMALAIKWVSKNIKEFGGDPSRITLFGNDAGASSVHYLLTSPMTKNLVKGGISQSGTATCLWALGSPGVGRYRASRLAQYLNCPLTPDKDMIDCLKTKTPYDIADGEKSFTSNDFDPFIPYQPVVESEGDCVICDSPYNLPVEKPWIVGINKDEGAARTLWYILKPELYLSFIERGADTLAESLMYANTTSYPDKLSKTIISTYRNLSMTDMWTDGMFFNGLTSSLKKTAAGPTFMYFFNYRGKTSTIDIFSQQNGIGIGNLGVSHTDECLYLFNYEDDLKITKTPADTQMSKALIALWTNFARHGRPVLNNEWPEYDQLRKQYLNIGQTNLTVRSNLWPEREIFWDSLPVRDIMEDIHL